MGASYVSRVYPDMPEAELTKRVNDDISQDAYEDGRSYSGSWGVKNGYHVVRERSGSSAIKTFDSVNAADEYISDANDKWEPLMAVRARIVEIKLPNGKVASTANTWDGERVPRGKAVIALDEKAKAAGELLQKFGPGIIARVKAAKSKTKGCSKCGSSIATSHIKSLNCPVCNHEYLLTETDRNKLASLKEKSEKARKAASDARAAELKKLSEKHGKLVWVVGGWCSS